MKKLFLSLVAALLAVPTFAQFTSGGFTLSESNVYYGVRLGMSVANLSGDDVDMDAKTGLTLAGVVGLRLSDGVPVFLESGLYYTERGAKKEKTSVGYNNLEIPVLVKYGFQATDEIAIIPFIGPYFSYAISGRMKNKNLNLDQSSFRDNCFKHPDMGFKFGVGADYNKLYLEIAYQAGVANISKADPLTSHGHAFNINFGVNF